MSEGFWIEIEEDGHQRRVGLSGTETSIGRDADNAIVVNDRRSSRRHCRLVVESRGESPGESPGLVLEDLGSRNGTVLKGTTVTRSVVESGDEFSIGKTRLRVRHGPMPEGEPGAPRVGPDRAEADEDSILEQTVATSSPKSSRPSPPPDAGKAGGGGTPERIGNKGVDKKGIDKKRADKKPPVKKRGTAKDFVLECIGGDRKGEKIQVVDLPFGIGRRSANALPLKDQRASGEHARIVEVGEVYYVEDLGSRNGTYLDRRAVTRSLLTPGSVLHIGSHEFRVRVPRSNALAMAMKNDGSSGESAADPGEERAAEDLGRFEVEAFAGGARSEHPLAVVLIVLILGVICYFSVDVARRILIRPPLDPPVGENDLGDSWSFEAPASEGADGSATGGTGVAVPGWKLPEGDRGRLRASSEFAQYPGRQALHLAGEGGAGVLTRAVFERSLAVRAGARCRLGGFVRNQGAFAAGFLVEWFGDVDGETVLVGRSFSETARERSEVLNVDQVVTVPGSVSRARFACFTLGGSGRSVFDRVVFAALGEQVDEQVEGGDAEEREQSTERTYRFGAPRDGERTGRGQLSLRLRPDGTMSLARGRGVVLPRLWLGLAPDVDPGQFGSRLAALRVLTEEDGSLSFVAQLPDLVSETWATVEGSIFVAAAELTLRLRTVSSQDREEGGDGTKIGLYFEPRDPRVPLRFPGSGEDGSLDGGKVPAGAQDEMILGEKGGQVVFGFSPGAYLDHVVHPDRKGPDGKGRHVLVASSRRDELAMRVSMTSRLEREATLRIVREAESLYRAGRVGAAVELLGRVSKLFPEQAAEIELARTRIERWRQEGATALDDLQRDLATLRASPGPVLYGVLQSRAADVETRFDGMTPAAHAAQLAGEARAFWEAEAEKRREQEITSIYERGRAHFVADRIGLAKLYLSRVFELGAGTKWARQAKITLDSIEKRRSEQRASHLR